MDRRHACSTTRMPVCCTSPGSGATAPRCRRRSRSCGPAPPARTSGSARTASSTERLSASQTAAHYTGASGTTWASATTRATSRAATRTRWLFTAIRGSTPGPWSTAHRRPPTRRRCSCPSEAGRPTQTLPSVETATSCCEEELVQRGRRRYERAPRRRQGWRHEATTMVPRCAGHCSFWKPDVQKYDLDVKSPAGQGAPEMQQSAEEKS
mmetsp:Transcript_129402/g.414765  ORF Transcript_129402/g.414765 Transcript_129402/m.414765 type:complete len:210 (+) Transcript_129402:935-1564(+)